MENKNDFQSFVEKANSSEQHAQEIQQTRVGGLGGSDAALVMKIGKAGLASLNNSDIKRLAIMVGLAEQDNWSGNAYTNAGHKFEDWYEDYIVRTAEAKASNNVELKAMFVNGSNYEREFVMGQTLAHNFKTFAHADFAFGNFMAPTIVECKFVTTKTTDKVIDTYMPQLQWYYMLGAKDVHLLHGTGTVDDEQAGTVFEVQDGNLVSIPRDEEAIKTLLNGIKILDKALADGWTPVTKDKAALSITTATVQDAFNALRSAKAKAQEAKDEETAAKATIREYMDTFGYNGIVDEESGNQVTLVSGKTTTTFDLKSFVKKITEKAQNEPSISLTLETILETIEESKKTSTSAPSITFK